MVTILEYVLTTVLSIIKEKKKLKLSMKRFQKKEKGISRRIKDTRAYPMDSLKNVSKEEFANKLSPKFSSLFHNVRARVR